MKDVVWETAYAAMTVRRTINRDDLDREVTEQPNLYGEADEMAVVAKSRAVKAGEDLKLIEAKLYRVISEKRTRDGDRCTDPLVKALVDEHPKRRKYFLRKLKADEWLRRWESMAETFRQRGYMLRELCQLTVSGYYGSRTVSTAATRHVSDRAHEAAHEAITQKRKSMGGWKEES